MNKKPPFSAAPAFGTKIGNLHPVRWSQLLATIASLLVASLCLGHSAQVNLAWDASPDSTITGYKVRYGTTSGNPNQTVTVGIVTTATVTSLSDATTYYFTVLAYNSAGTESRPSNQVSYRTPGQGSTTYTLTVNSGSGDGSYAPSTQVAVNANSPPAGQEFDIWTGDYQILADPSSSSTTATMPSVNATISATYSSASSADRIR
jgi:Fibronectin type III domain/Divergent InlB B-repeat domain